MGQIKINNEIFGSDDASDIVYRDTTSVKKAIDDLYKNGGGSQVEVSAIQTEGTHIANVIINGETTEIYAPKGGELGSLADIEITNPSAKQTLIYDDKKKKWINVSLNESKEVEIALPEILQTKVNVTSFTLTEDNVYVFISFNASSGGSPTNGHNSIVSSTMEKIYFERNISVGSAERGSAAFGVFKGNIGDTLQINAQACCTKLIKTDEEFNIIGHDIANTPSDVAYIVKEYNKDTLDTNNHRYYVAMVSCSGNGGQTCSITCEDGKRTEIIQQANGGSGYCLLDSFLVEKDTLHNIHLYAKSTTNNTSYPKAAGYFIGYFRCNNKEDETIQGGGSGSGGSSVEWNQIQTSGTKIAEVTIDGTKKDVFAPTGGSGGGSYSETVLYDYREDNGGVICYDTTTQTLRDDVENYDLLCLEFASSAGDLTSAEWNSTNEIMVNVNLLSNGYNPNYILYTSYDTRSSRHYIKGKEFKTTTRNQGNTNGLVRMLGIKF